MSAHHIHVPIDAHRRASSPRHAHVRQSPPLPRRCVVHLGALQVRAAIVSAHHIHVPIDAHRRASAPRHAHVRQSPPLPRRHVVHLNTLQEGAAASSANHNQLPARRVLALAQPPVALRRSTRRTLQPAVMNRLSQDAQRLRALRHKRVRPNRLGKVLQRQQRHPHHTKHLAQPSLPRPHIVPHPPHHSLVHRPLAPHRQPLRPHQLEQRLPRQPEELRLPRHRRKPPPHHKQRTLRHHAAPQPARLRPHRHAVRRLDVRAHPRAALRLHPLHPQEPAPLQQRQPLRHARDLAHLAAVQPLHHPLQHARLHLVHLERPRPALHHRVLEHRAEVLAAARHHARVHLEHLAAALHLSAQAQCNRCGHNAGSIDEGLGEAEEDYTFRSVKRRSLRRPARWRASCAACVSSILEVGAAGAEEEAAESCRDRLRGAIVFKKQLEGGEG